MTARHADCEWAEQQAVRLSCEPDPELGPIVASALERHYARMCACYHAEQE